MLEITVTLDVSCYFNIIVVHCSDNHVNAFLILSIVQLPFVISNTALVQIFKLIDTDISLFLASLLPYIFIALSF